MNSVAREFFRTPFVQLRLLFETPAVWAPALAAALLVAVAWHLDRSRRTNDRSARVAEVSAGIFGVAMLVWFFHAGQFPWSEGDWREEWSFFVAWKQAFASGTLPYYLGTAMQGTERYFANMQTPMMPYVVGLSVLSVNTFLLFHIAFVYAVGFAGVIALRRELDLRLLPWTLFTLIFTLNGHIVAHLSVGHLPWVAYFLTPWVLWSAVRAACGDRSFRVAAICAATFAGMILVGGWHVFVWSWLFMIGACLVSPQRLVMLARIGVITALLAAARLAPGILTFGTGSNAFISGFPSAASVFDALIGSPAPSPLLDLWELDAYVGIVGFLLLIAGAIPFREAGKRFLNVMLLPSAMLLVLSLGHLYGDTLFRLPGFVSERVTTRLIVLPILWLTLAAAVRIDTWWRSASATLVRSIPVLLGGLLLAMQLVLRAQGWQPHAGSSEGGLATVLKTQPVESLYFWAFWLGLVVSIVTILATARSCSRRFTGP